MTLGTIESTSSRHLDIRDGEEGVLSFCNGKILGKEGQKVCAMGRESGGARFLFHSRIAIPALSVSLPAIFRM